MFTTKKLYEENKMFMCQAQVLDVLNENGMTSVVLDQTVFRPNDLGGAQELGVIESESKAFHVTRAKENEGAIRHFGTFESDPFEPDERVTCVLDKEYKKEIGLDVE
ncbi:hypothetical protein HY732_00360 [Candidatus Uhrbacteria bacterium]|nr:hypothetical protein [Candidatus Uhrbacteria bacterium]